MKNPTRRNAFILEARLIPPAKIKLASGGAAAMLAISSNGMADS